MYADYSTDAFEEKYTYTGNDLGVTWSPEKSVFRLWAPTADDVAICLYRSGSPWENDLIDKILQWMLIPRTLMMGIILIMSVTLPFIYMSLAIKWWIIASLILLVFAIATPNYLVDKQWDRAFMKIPFVIITSLLHINVLGHRSHR